MANLEQKQVIRARIRQWKAIDALAVEGLVDGVVKGCEKKGKGYAFTNQELYSLTDNYIVREMALTPIMSEIQAFVDDWADACDTPDPGRLISGGITGTIWRFHLPYVVIRVQDVWTLHPNRLRGLVMKEFESYGLRPAGSKMAERQASYWDKLDTEQRVRALRSQPGLIQLEIVRRDWGRLPESARAELSALFPMTFDSFTLVI